VAAARAAGLPPTAPVYIGSYGVSDRIGERVHSLPQGRYAPMFNIQPGWFWERRRLDPRAAKELLSHNPGSSRLAGPLP